MLESWLLYWPKDLTITVYTEDFINFNSDRVKFISLDTMDLTYFEFLNSKLKLNDRAKTFAKKAWPIMENLKSSAGKLIWIDADVITTSDITYEWIDSLINKDDFSSHIGVMQNEFYSVETGFFIINLENSFKDNFYNTYRSIYVNRNFSDMKKPFDGDVFGKVIREMSKNKKFKYNELSADTAALSPFNKIFKDKMMHYKAKRKNNFNDYTENNNAD
jgi:hypothetical protein